MCRTGVSDTFPIMLIRSRRLVLPAVVVAAALVSSGAALLPAPSGPFDDGFGVSDTQVAATPVPDDESYMYSVDVLRRGLTYAYDLDAGGETGWYAVTEARALTPDLGLAPLTLGAATTPPFTDSYGTAQNDLWAVSLADEAEALILRVTGGGATRTVELPPTGPSTWSADRAIWKNTALVAGSLVNLATLDVVPVADSECDEPLGAALADGLLAVHDSCDDVINAYAISAEGVQAGDLAADPVATVAAPEGVEGDLALSRGLLAWSVALGESGSEIRYAWLDSGRTGTGSVPYPALRVVAQGTRILVVAAQPESDVVDAWVFEALTEDLGAPVAHVEVLYGTVWTGSGPGPEPSPEPVPAPDGEVLLGTSTATEDRTGDVDVDYLPVDLYGRTLVWFAPDGSIKAGTIPALRGGAATVGTSGAPKVGQKLTVTGAGFVPGEEVAVWLQSTPVLLATGFAGADGRVSLDVTIPAATAVGAHTVTLVGVESGWRADSAVTVAAAGNTGLRIDTGR